MRNDERLALSERHLMKANAILSLVDDFTHEAPSASVRVLIEGVRRSPVRNRSGYYLLFGLSPGTNACLIQCEGFYDYRTSLAIAETAEPVVQSMLLVPRPSYPFPAGATLLRGLVMKSGSESPLEGVRVTVQTKNAERTVFTDEDGNFVVYLTHFSAEMVKKKNGSTYVRGDDDTAELSAVFEKTGFGTDSMGGLSVEVGSELHVKEYLSEGGT